MPTSKWFDEKLEAKDIVIASSKRTIDGFESTTAYSTATTLLFTVSMSDLRTVGVAREA